MAVKKLRRTGGRGAPPFMVKNATSWFPEDHSWLKTTSHGKKSNIGTFLTY
jgi:hypothetical protein